MSNFHGVALGKIDPFLANIYKFEPADGEPRYRVFINTKRIYHYETYETLPLALEARDKVLAKGSTRQIRKLGELVTVFRKKKEGLESYATISRHLDEILEFWGFETPLKKFTEEEVERFKKYLDNRERRPGDRRQGALKNKTKNDYLKRLKEMLLYARDKGSIPNPPTIELYPNAKSKRALKIDVKTFHEILIRLPLPDQFAKPHRALWLMQLFTGQRWKNVASMKWSELGTIREHELVSYRSSKTQVEDIEIYMKEPLVSELLRLRSFQRIHNVETVYIFANPKTRRPYTSIRKPLETICRTLGIDMFEPNYQLRHLSATQYLLFTKDTDAVAKVMGHKNRRMVEEVYGHMMAERALPGTEGISEQLTRMAANGDRPQTILENVVSFATLKTKKNR